MKNTEYSLYLDLDGVLVNFDDGYMKLAGKSIIQTAKDEGDKAARNKYLDAGSQYWENLEWIEGGKEIWNTASSLFNAVYILSSVGTTDPVRGKPVDEGKRRWLKKNIPSIDLSNVFIVGGSHMKKTYSAKNAVLVDDMPKNINEWNQAGGIGILHNSKHYKKTIESLKDISQSLNLSEIVKRIRH